MKISRFFFGGFRFSSYFCQRLTDDCRQSGRATVSPMAFSRRLFLCPRVSFPGNGKKVYLYGGCMNRRFDKSFRISHHLLSNGECSRHPFVQSAVNA